MNPTAEAIDAQTVRFERLLPGPIERVWEYLTKPDLQRSWLAESAAEFGGATRVEPHRSIEYRLRDRSVVSMELEPRGEDVKLVLTHRRAAGWLTGAGTVILAAILAFSFCRPEPRPPEQSSSPHDRLGLQLTQAQHITHVPPSLNSLHVKPEPLYAMLGGRC